MPHLSQEERIENLEKAQAEILSILRPIADTYKAAGTIGKWFMAMMVFVSILLGIILSIKGFFR